MITKAKLLECSIANFIKFGSKAYTMDELANDLGMSKKTIYSYFQNKENLVSESLSFLVDEIRRDIQTTIKDEKDPILKVILIYEIGFRHYKSFKPSFLFGLKKYYPKADQVFEDFRQEIVNEKVRHLLVEAQEKGVIRPDVNLELVCELYLLRVENVAFKKNNLYENHSSDVLLQHLIVNNLRGIVRPNYSNRFFLE